MKLYVKSVTKTVKSIKRRQTAKWSKSTLCGVLRHGVSASSSSTSVASSIIDGSFRVSLENKDRLHLSRPGVMRRAMEPR